MKKTKTEEDLLAILERVKKLQEYQDDETIRELSSLIQESKELSYQYRFRTTGKQKLEDAYIKLNEAEDLAIDYLRKHKINPVAPSGLKSVFEAFLEGFKGMFSAD